MLSRQSKPGGTLNAVFSTFSPAISTFSKTSVGVNRREYRWVAYRVDLFIHAQYQVLVANCPRTQFPVVVAEAKRAIIFWPKYLEGLSHLPWVGMITSIVRLPSVYCFTNLLALGRLYTKRNVLVGRISCRSRLNVLLPYSYQGAHTTCFQTIQACL